MCGAVYIAEYGSRAEADRLAVCTSPSRGRCPEHARYAAWIALDPQRRTAYAEQVERFDHQGGEFEQGALTS